MFRITTVFFKQTNKKITIFKNINLYSQSQWQGLFTKLQVRKIQIHQKTIHHSQFTILIHKIILNSQITLTIKKILIQ